MEELPLVSVITPSYNYAEYVTDAINSVLNQTWTNVEHIIVDDGSSDDSVAIIQSFSKNPRVTLIALTSNRGYSVAKNIGIKAAQGQYISTIDADDMLTQNSLEVRTKFLMTHPEYDVVHGQVYRLHGAGDFNRDTTGLVEEPCGGSAVRDHLRRNAPPEEAWDTINAQGVLCHRGVYERIGLYDEGMRWKADREMWYRMLHNGCRLGYVEAYVAFYRHHCRNMSQSEARRLSNIEEVFKEKCRERNGSLDFSSIEKLAPLEAYRLVESAD